MTSAQRLRLLHTMTSERAQVLTRYEAQAKVNSLLQLRLVVSSGALEVYNPKAIDTGRVKGYKPSVLSTSIDYVNGATLGKRGGAVRGITNDKIRGRVCHNYKGTTDKQFIKR